MVSALAVGTNTYQTRAAANTLLGDRVHAPAWEFIDDTTKDLSLITAFTDLEQLGLVDPDTSVAVDPNAAPVAIKSAQAELAFVYSEDPEAAQATSSDGTNVRAVKAGSAQVQFFAPADGSRFPKRVMDLIKPYLPTVAGATSSGSYMTGAREGSAFDADDELLLNRGFS